MSTEKVGACRPTQQALTVLRERYLAKDPETGEIIETPDEMIRRVARCIAESERLYGGSEETVRAIAEDFYRLMAENRFWPNTPTLINAGRPGGYRQYAACFVVPILDQMDSITDAIKAAMLIWQSGGGTGFSFSRLRPKGDRVRSSGGIASGPVSFMKIIDAAAEQVAQGGTRRAANMSILSCDHPDIFDFIRCKAEDGRIRNFNISVAVTDAFMHAVERGTDWPLINPRTGQAVKTVRARQVWDEIIRHAWRNGEPGLFFIDRANADNPIPHLGRIESTNPCFPGTERLLTADGRRTFQELFDSQIPLKVLTDNRVMDPTGSGLTTRPAAPVFKTREHWPVWKLTTVGGCAVRATADHQFFTPSGKKALSQLASGEPVLVHDDRGAGIDCVRTIRPDGVADVFCTTEPVTRSIIVNGFVVANCGEKPLVAWDACTLGHVNLEAHLVERNGRMVLDGDLLKETVQVGVRFLDNVIDAADHPLPQINEMTRKTRQIGLGVMGLSRVLFAEGIPYDSEDALRYVHELMAQIKPWAWECSVALARMRGVYPAWHRSLHEAKDRKVRNSYVLTVAPTGSVSMIAHTSPGIEPEFSLLWYKRVLDGKQIPYVCEPFERVARAEGWWSEELLKQIQDNHGSCRGLAQVPERWQHVFATAHDIAPDWHVRMQAVVQRHVDSAVSKTINLPTSASVEDMVRAYRMAWELGCKGVTVYRDGSRQDQVLNVGSISGNGASRNGSGPESAPNATAGPIASGVRPVALSAVLMAKRVRVESPDGGIYVHIGYAGGRPVEVFATTPEEAKHEEVYEAFARIFSIALPWGVPLEKLLKQLEGANRKYGSVATIPAAILRAFRMVEPEGKSDACPKCAGAVVFQEGCLKCLSCGWSRCD